MRVNRWELNGGYRGKSSRRNDLRLIECVLRVFGNLGRRSDPESSILTISRDRAIFPNCRKLMLGKALDFNGFRNYCGFRGSGPPASPRSTACSCLLFSNGMTTRDHSSGGHGGFDSGRSSRDVDKRWNRYNRAALCRAEETESSVQLILGHHTSSSCPKPRCRAGQAPAAPAARSCDRFHQNN